MKKILLLLFVGMTTLCSLFAEGEKANHFELGGALRFNYFYKSWEKGVNASFDTWKINGEGTINNVDIVFDYRFYPESEMSFLKVGYFGYSITENLYAKLGVVQVPFGIEGVVGHSFFYHNTAFIGLEEDYDMGITFDYKLNSFDLTFAYFRSMEAGGPNKKDDNSGRFSADILGNQREQHQFNARIDYNINKEITIGTSGQTGKIKNLTTGNTTNAIAAEAHLVLNFGKFNFKGQFSHYNYKAEDNKGNILKQVKMGSFGTIYNVAAKGNVAAAGVAYEIPVKFGPITSIQAYLDYSVILKDESLFEDTHMLIPGFYIDAKPLYLFIDFVFAKNNFFINGGSESFAAGTQDADWNTRININVGYYF